MTRWYQHEYHTLFAHKFVFATIPHLPKSVHPPIAAVTALIFLLLLKNERRAVCRNLARIGGRSGWRGWWKVYKVFYSFCDFVVSYCYVPKADHAGLLAMLSEPDRGAGQIERCLAQGKGLIVWTAHLGNWEFGSRLLEMHGRPVHVARVVEHDNAAEMMLRNLMSSERLKIVQLNGDLLASVQILHALRANEIVAMQGDRVYQAFCSEVNFFGEKASFPLGPFLLSYISGAPVLPGIVVRDGWLRYRVVMGEPIWPSSNGDRDRDMRAGLVQAAGFLERALETYHDQWLNFYDFWAGAAPQGVSEQQCAVVVE